jgi:ATP-dependent helicase/nuclease subunit A
VKLTDAQRAVVEHRGSSLVVSASAGSGKTEVLARRCVALIADPGDPCPVDRMLVVTFTRAAAAELRARIAGMLRDALEESRDPLLRQHLLRQTVLLDAAEIGTIDSWCSRLVRENYSQSGVDPAFAVLSAEDDQLLRRNTLEELMNRIFTEDDETAHAARAWIGRNARPSAGFLREAIKTLLDFRDHLIDDEAWHAAQVAAYSRPAEELSRDAARQLAATTAQECAFQVEQLSAVIEAASDDRVRKVLSDYGATLHSWRDELADPARIMAVASAIDAYQFPRRPPRLADDDVRRWVDVKDRWLGRRLREFWGAEAIRPVLENAPRAAELVLLLLHLERRLSALLTAEKRRRSAYGFGDVQRLALRVLADGTSEDPGRPSAVAARLREHYLHVLVDEVQDTSPVQFELLRLVSRDAPGRSNGFLVGDVKQSIYGFRQAEPQLFAEIIGAIQAGTRDGRAIALTDNFRSHDRLVRAVNGVFAGLFDSTLGGVALDSAAQLRAQRAEIENPTLDAAPRVELHILSAMDHGDAASDEDGDDEDAMPLERIERESAIAAERIQTLVREGAIPETAPNGVLRLRPIRYSDIVILLRAARGNAPLAAAALRATGVPAVAVGRESMLDNLEVRDVRNILSLIGNRRQDIAVAAYLRGPLVGLSPAELLGIREISADVPFYETVLAAAKSETSLGSRVRTALDRIERLVAAARHIDLPDLVRAIIREGSLKHFARALPGGEHRVAMLQALEDFADEFAAAGRSGVSEFVEHLESLDAEGLRPASATAVTDDVVRVMTIHASKGLEFPIVLMLNCGAQFSRRPRGKPLRADERLGIGLSFYDYPQKMDLATAAHPILKRRAAARDLDEELRLLYVAATRAREKLIFVGHGDVDRWRGWQSRGTGTTAPPPLIDRLTVASGVDWLMMGIACSDPRGEFSLVTTPDSASATPVSSRRAAAVEEPSGSRQSDSGTNVGELPESDGDWVESAMRFIRARIDSAGSRRPAALSVSALKDETGESDRPHRWIDAQAELSLPRFAVPSTADGRDRGTATHRYFQFADHAVARNASSVRAELQRLVRDGRIAPGSAALIDSDEIAWFSGISLGRECADSINRCRREVPFVYALPAIDGGEPMLVRGVIDCILERDAGLVLIDYKTDRPIDAGDLALRVARYETQIRLYALAAASIFQRPVQSAHLVLLGQRRVLDVPVGQTELERLLAQTDAFLRQMG